MDYAHIAIRDDEIPRAALPFGQHIVDTYASESNKVASVWREFLPEMLAYRPHPKASSVADIMRHQLLSERRFFAEFMGMPEPEPDHVLPAATAVEDLTSRVVELARRRLPLLAAHEEAWWLQLVPFFDVQRQRVWVFWRRVLHTAHHRTQLTVYLRLLERAVPPTYGPTADVSWAGADPTTSVAAAGRPRPSP